MKALMLRLLLMRDGMESADAWAAALEGGCAVVESEGADEQEERVVAAIDRVVPYLLDYSAVSGEVNALMSYVEVTYSKQMNRLVQGWLQRGHNVHFRRWVLCDWLKCSHLVSADPVDLLQWRHALMVAATNETVKTLKRKLLKLLSAVGDKIAAQSKEKNREQTTEVPVAEFQSLETVNELHDFCFLNAEQLATCSLLCAAKLHAMAVKTQRGAIKLTEDDEVMVRLRWSLMLKPMLFKPLLQHAIALKALPSIITACPLWTSQELERLVAFVDVAKREIILGRMRESRRELERAFASGSGHIYATRKTKVVVAARVIEYIQALSADKKKLLLAELERDLVEAPPHLFPHIFMFFELVLGATLSSSVPDQNLLVLATNILFALFDRRSHDGDSYFDVLGLLLRQSLASSSLWLDHQQFYVQTIEALSETATLQVEPKLKWAAKMALQQLLFECDVHLLQLEQSSLSKLLPPSTMRLVSIRFN